MTASLDWLEIYLRILPLLPWWCITCWDIRSRAVFGLPPRCCPQPLTMIRRPPWLGWTSPAGTAAPPATHGISVSNETMRKGTKLRVELSKNHWSFISFFTVGSYSDPCILRHLHFKTCGVLRLQSMTPSENFQYKHSISKTTFNLRHFLAEWVVLKHTDHCISVESTVWDTADF